MDQQLTPASSTNEREKESQNGEENAALISQLSMEYNELDKAAYDAQSEVLTKLISLEKSNSEWYYLLYNSKKHQRKSTHNTDAGFPMPSKDEILSIAKASDLDPDNPKIIFARCTVMLEFVKHHGVFWSGNICFGKGHFFTNADSIVDSVKSEVRRVLTLDPKSDVTNIGAFEIFASGLPPKLREPDFAFECLNNAVVYNPESGKANSRIASYYYQSAISGVGFTPEEIEHNFQLAEEHYLRAVEIERKNLNAAALIDLLQTVYMNRNPQKFKELIDVNIDGPEWDDTKRSKLYFVKGLHHFLQDENQSGFDSWVLGYKLDQRLLEKMKYLNRDALRYGWPDTLKSEQIFRSLGQLKRSGALTPELSRITVRFRENLAAQVQAPLPPKSTFKSRRWCDRDDSKPMPSAMEESIKRPQSPLAK